MKFVRISVVLRISGRTFEFPVERSNFRSNVQNSKKRVIRKFRWYLQFPVQRSNFQSNVQNKKERIIRIFRWYCQFPVERSNLWSNVQNSKKRVIRKFRPHPQKSYKNNIKSYKNHVKLYKNHIKSFPQTKEGRLGWGSYLSSIELPLDIRIARCQDT